MKQLLFGVAVIASLATSLIEANAQYSCGGFLEMSCEEFETRVAAEHASDIYYSEQNQELHREEAREAAEVWADTYLAEEKAAAVYWRQAYVLREAETTRGGSPDKRMGRLGTPEGRYIYGDYVCDTNYGDALTGGCVPADRDYDCRELRSWGIAGIPIIGEDWMILDEDGDGWGCEFPSFESIAPQSAVQDARVTAPTAEPADRCDGILGSLGCLLGQ